jgi:dCTP deaminase
MSILADAQIKELCQIPNVEITEFIQDGFALEKVKRAILLRVKRVAYCSDKDIESMQFQLNLAEKLLSPNYERDTTGIISYRLLTELEQSLFKPMISPFVGEQVRYRVKKELIPEGGFPLGVMPMISSSDTEKILSYGLSSAGYDVRLSNEFKVFTNINSVMIDPLDFDEKCLHDHKGDYCIIPPNSYILGVTVETFNIPDDVMVVCVGKSTYARCGAIINVTPIEPGFKGKVVIEIANSTSLPLKVYADMGISQFLFFKMTQPAKVPYSSGDRKYQNQDGLTLAKV